MIIITSLYKNVLDYILKTQVSRYKNEIKIDKHARNFPLNQKARTNIF